MSIYNQVNNPLLRRPVELGMCTSVHVHPCACAPLCMCTSANVRPGACAPLCMCPPVHVHPCACVPLCMCTPVQVYGLWIGTHAQAQRHICATSFSPRAPRGRPPSPP